MSQTSIEIYNTVTDVQVIEVTAGGLTTTADLNAAVTAASGSATAAAASAASASSAASSATASASSATTSAASAATSASSATVSASTATTQANVATTAASEAEASAVSALDSSNAAAASETAAASSASSAASSAATATTQATTATTQAGIASTAATTATEQATIATTGANTATTQAGIATTAATSASASASQAASSAAQAAAVTLQQSFGRKFVPTISLDATSRTLPSYLSCTRAGVATFFDQAGVLRTAANNEGRIDFDPVTGECLGLLDEEAATNLFQNSELFNSAFAVNAAVSDGLIQSPSVSTMRLVASTAGINAWVRLRATGSTQITSYNVFCVLQKGTQYGAIGSPNKYIKINLDNGSIAQTKGTGVTSSVVRSLVNPNQFFCRFSTTDIAGMPHISIWNPSVNDVGGQPSCANGDTLLVSCVTFSENSTSYIRTTGATVTRPADLFATTGFQFARRYNQREGTFYINTRAISDLTTTVAVFSDGTTNNETRLLANGTLTIRKGGVQIATIQATGATLTAHSIFGFTYKGTRVVITRNGATVGVVTASEELATNYTTFQLGTGIYVRNLRYVPRAFSDSELQFVTNPLYFVGLEGDKVPTINDLSSGAFMEVQDLQTLRTRSEITIFGSGALRSIVINRPYPFLIEQVYVSPTGVTTATLPTLPAAGFYAANTDYTVLFNATADRTLVLAIIPQTIN